MSKMRWCSKASHQRRSGSDFQGQPLLCECIALLWSRCILLQPHRWLLRWRIRPELRCVIPTPEHSGHQFGQGQRVPARKTISLFVKLLFQTDYLEHEEVDADKSPKLPGWGPVPKLVSEASPMKGSGHPIVTLNSQSRTWISPMGATNSSRVVLKHFFAHDSNRRLSLSLKRARADLSLFRILRKWVTRTSSCPTLYTG